MSQMYLVNYSNLLSADLLRRKPNMGKKVCLNLIGHSLGAMHLKMLVCGDSNGARAFVSGIDFIPNRVDSQNHINSGKFGWHDIGAKVEGPAIKGIYAYYKQVWDEQISRNIETFNLAGECKVKSHEKDFEKVPDPNFPIDTPGKMHVQVLRTAPQMNFGLGGISTSIQLYFRSRLISGFQRKSWDSATNGIFEFRTALYKAIMGAKKYIYVEDQSFWGQPIMEWLRSRLHVEPELHLIMIHHPDPADKPNLGKNLSPLTATAINNYLGPAETNMNNQVAFYERIDEVIIHSKVWIIDDVFFIIGSANCSRRSLYTDGEISIGVIDEEDSKMAIQFRKLLWGEHCGLFTDQDRAKLDNINLALKIWDESWGGGGNAPAALLPIFQRKHVPFEAGTGEGQWPNGVDTSVTAQQYDVSDADSRMEY
jgi:phosphatidylserine/phosphatidylglycerophosphate/cardiolipin synthase-like enzyme